MMLTPAETSEMEPRMSESLNRSASPATGSTRVHWWSTRASQRLVKLITTAFLEVIPVEAALVVAAGYNSSGTLVTPVPFWFLLATLLLFVSRSL